jgi:replicative DNA helicase
MYDSTLKKAELNRYKLAKMFSEVAILKEVMANLSRLKWVIDSAENFDQKQVKRNDKRTVRFKFNYVQRVTHITIQMMKLQDLKKSIITS